MTQATVQIDNAKTVEEAYAAVVALAYEAQHDVLQHSDAYAHGARDAYGYIASCLRVTLAEREIS